MNNDRQLYVFKTIICNTEKIKMRQCIVCKKTKSIRQFPKSTNNVDKCIACHATLGKK